MSSVAELGWGWGSQGYGEGTARAAGRLLIDPVGWGIGLLGNFGAVQQIFVLLFRKEMAVDCRERLFRGPRTCDVG